MVGFSDSLGEVVGRAVLPARSTLELPRVAIERAFRSVDSASMKLAAPSRMKTFRASLLAVNDRRALISVSRALGSGAQLVGVGAGQLVGVFAAPGRAQAL